MDDAKGGGGRAGGVVHACQTLAFAYHTVFEVSYVEDMVPIGSPTLFQLRGLVVEKLAVEHRSLGRQQNLRRQIRSGLKVSK